VTAPAPTLSDAPTAPPVVVEDQYEDYFGFAKTEAYTLPDGKQQIFFQVMNEGQKTQFQKKISMDIHVNQQTRDTRIKTDVAGERRALITSSVTGWSLKQRNPQGQWVDAQFGNNGTPGDLLNQWLDKADPKIVEGLEDAIRKANPWLQQEMTVEQIDEEMSRLADLRAEVLKTNAKDAAFQG
jgi:hypothetical protein